MERDKFIKMKFKAFMAIDFFNKRDNNIVECILLAVDFEQELFTLEAVDKETYYSKPFDVRREYCELPKPKLKIVTNK